LTNRAAGRRRILERSNMEITPNLVPDNRLDAQVSGLVCGGGSPFTGEHEGGGGVAPAILPVLAEDVVDSRLVFLTRAGARLVLVESGEMDLDEAFDGLVGTLKWRLHTRDGRALGARLSA
jgi:hypothetical protein